MAKSQQKSSPLQPEHRVRGPDNQTPKKPGRRPRSINLSMLGAAIKDGRTKRGFARSQEEFAKEVAEELRRTHTSFEISETLIARLERGGIQDPNPQVLRAVAKLLGEDYTAFVGHLIAEKYGIDSETLAPLFRQPITMTKLAEWESAQDEFWVIASDIVDARDSQFATAVRNVVVDRKGQAVFFVPVQLLPTFATIKSWALRDVSDTAVRARLTAVPLVVEQQAVLAASFIIGNPSGKNRTAPSGYLILNDKRAEPYMAFQMYESEISKKIGHLAQLLNVSQTPVLS